MARMMRKNYNQRSYCHCCNEVVYLGRTREKRQWREEEDVMSIIKYTHTGSSEERLPGTQPGAPPPEVHDEQDRQDQALLGEADARGPRD